MIGAPIMRWMRLSWQSTNRGPLITSVNCGYNPSPPPFFLFAPTILSLQHTREIPVFFPRFTMVDLQKPNIEEIACYSKNGVSPP